MIFFRQSGKPKLRFGKPELRSGRNDVTVLGVMSTRAGQQPLQNSITALRTRSRVIWTQCHKSGCRGERRWLRTEGIYQTSFYKRRAKFCRGRLKSNKTSFDV